MSRCISKGIDPPFAQLNRYKQYIAGDVLRFKSLLRDPGPAGKHLFSFFLMLVTCPIFFKGKNGKKSGLRANMSA